MYEPPENLTVPNVSSRKRIERLSLEMTMYYAEEVTGCLDIHVHFGALF